MVQCGSKSSLTLQQPLKLVFSVSTTHPHIHTNTQTLVKMKFYEHLNWQEFFECWFSQKLLLDWVLRISFSCVRVPSVSSFSEKQSSIVFNVVLIVVFSMWFCFFQLRFKFNVPHSMLHTLIVSTESVFFFLRLLTQCLVTWPQLRTCHSFRIPLFHHTHTPTHTFILCWLMFLKVVWVTLIFMKPTRLQLVFVH